MIWFDEGLAEYLTWSTDDQGVLPRETLVQQIANDGTNRMTVNEIVNVDYSSGFKFYRYGGLFFHYLQEHHLIQLLDLLEHAHNSNIADFDLAVTAMATDSAMETGYQAHLDTLVNNLTLLSNPSTSYPDTAIITPLNLEDLEDEFPGHWQNCSVSVIDTNPRFTCGGVLATVSYPSPPGADVLWTYYDERLSEIQTHLKTISGINNFDQITCRFSGIKVHPITNQSTFYALADYHCDGPMEPGTYTRADPAIHIEANMLHLREIGGVECVEQSTGAVECTAPGATTLYPLGTDYAVMLDEYMADIEEVENQLYAQSPSYYHDLECDAIGTPIEHEHSSGDGVYLYGDFVCTINV